MQEPVFIMLGGLTGTEPNRSPRFGPETYNVYTDEEGYLVNYPGRTDWFYREGDLPAYRGTPPPTSGTPKITRLSTFRDRHNQEHVVFVRNAELCVNVDNGYRVLYTFVGRDYGGLFFPEMIVHEGLLIVVNFGDPPLVWDGIIAPHPVGVHETPMAPEVKPSYAPGSNEQVNYGYFAWYNLWWTGERPQSWLANQRDASDNLISYAGQVRVQFIDRYGNRGRAGPPSRIFEIESKKTITTPAGGSADFESVQYACVDWHPPKIDEHVYGYEFGRTANYNRKDTQGGLAAYGLYWTELIQDGIFPTRFVPQLSDTMLQGGSQMDLLVGPPTQASICASWANRIVLSGHADPTRVTWSDSGMFGQFRPSQEFKARDHVTALIPIEGGPQTRQYSRVVVVTRSSVEVLYESGENVALLSQDYANGSRHGRSIVPVSGGVFGLWNDGFAFFDGQDFKKVTTPYFIKGVYLDDRHFVYSARIVGEWYVLSVRKDSATSGQNYILMYSLPTQSWYILKESVYDISEWRGAVLGSDDSIYELFKGPYSMEAVIDIDNIVPDKSSMAAERVLCDMNFAFEPSTTAQATVLVKSQAFDYDNSSDSRSMTMHSSMQGSGYGANDNPNPHWNQVNLAYAEEPNWNADDDVWIKADLSEPVVGTTHSIKVTVPSGNRVRVKAIRLLFSDDRRES